MIVFVCSYFSRGIKLTANYHGGDRRKKRRSKIYANGKEEKAPCFLQIPPVSGTTGLDLSFALEAHLHKGRVLRDHLYPVKFRTTLNGTTHPYSGWGNLFGYSIPLVCRSTTSSTTPLVHGAGQVRAAMATDAATTAVAVGATNAARAVVAVAAINAASAALAAHAVYVAISID